MRRRTTRLLGLSAGGGLALLLTFPWSPPPPKAPRGELVERLLGVVETAYIDAEVDADRLLEDGLDRMVHDLDRYGAFIPSAALEAHEQETEGYFVGIGVVIGPAPELLDPATGALEEGRAPEGPLHPVINAIIPGGPAAAAGLRVGERILEVDGAALSLGTSREATERILGPAGLPVELRLGEGETERRVRVDRRRVDLPSVTEVALYTPSAGAPVGLVRLEGFKPRSPEEVAGAVDQLLTAGAASVLLDLRGNGGGLMIQALDIASLFLPRGALILRTVGREPRPRAGESPAPREVVHRVEEEPRFPGIPLAVLIDGGSASASDIVASALRDHRRAPLIGEESFGKWAAQSAIPLSNDGRYGMVKLTTQAFYTETGGRIRRADDGARGGLIPDVEIPVDEETRLELGAAFRSRALERITDPLAVARRELPSAVATPGSPGPPDPILARAIDLLSQPATLAQLYAPEFAVPGPQGPESDALGEGEQR